MAREPKRTVIPEGAKWCPHCQRPKPATRDVWYPDRRTRDGLYPYCRNCARVLSALFQETEAGRASRAHYRQSEGYRKHREELKADPQWRHEQYEAVRRYCATDRGKLVRKRCMAIYRMRVAKTERARRNQRAKLAAVEAELAYLGWHPHRNRSEAS